MIDLITEQLRNGQITAIQALEQAADHTPIGDFLRLAAFNMSEHCANLTDELEAVEKAYEALKDSDDDAYDRGWNAALARFTDVMSYSLNELKLNECKK